jgi:magnesium and cobalt exporter, CNNM family
MIYIIATVLLMLIMAFFSGIETGLVSLRKSRVKHGVKQKVRRAEILDFFIHHPGYMLATTLIGTNICVVCASNSARRAAFSFGFEGVSSMFVVTGCMTVMLLLVEIVPKDWFRQQPYQRCLFFAYLLYASFIILYIPVSIMSAFTSYISRLVGKGKKASDAGRGLMREDFRILLRESESAHIIDAEAADILDRSLDFHDLTAKDILCPVGSVLEIPADMPVADAVAFCRKHRKSRVPVTMDTNVDKINNWKGIFTVYDALFDIPETEWKTTEVRDCLRPAGTVNEDAGMEDILKAAKSSGTRILIVCADDETQTHKGIVTPADVIKVLFG